MGSWIEKKLYDLTSENMELLIQNKIPAIRIKDFVAKDICKRVAERLEANAFQNYEHLKDIPVHHMGVCHNQLAGEPKPVYFDKVPKAEREILEIFAGIVDNPVHKVLAQLNERTDRKAQIFEEPGFGPYFAGAFRSFSGHGRLHVDHSPTHLKTDWAVTKISKQLTWNVYFSVLNSGGELVIYDSIHNDVNELEKVSGEYYFPYSVVDGSDAITIEPEVGDLIIFNTQNFHEILGNKDGRRISQTSFMGVKNDGTLNLWS